MAAGAVAFLLVCVCAGLAWPSDSPVAAQEGGATNGDAALAWAFLAAAAGAFVAYAAGVAVLAKRPGPPAAVVAALGAAIQLAPLAAPLLLSTDAWTYWDYGRIASVHGGNPYRDVPADFPADPAFPVVGADWREVSSVYGPAFTLASEPLARAAGDSEDAAAWTYKALACVSLLAAAALAAARSSRRTLAIVLVAWNPLLALHAAGGGHNDAWVAAALAAALALSARRRDAAAGVAWALATLVKWIPLALLPLALLERWRTGARIGRLAVAGVATAAALGAIATWRYGTAWIEAVIPLARNAKRETEYALPHRLVQLGLPHWLSLALAAAAFAGAYAWLLRSAALGRARLALAAAALLLTTPYLAPWYLAWLAPLAAAEDDRPARWLTLALTAYLLPQTVPV